uniref:Uncharacterized protein n=1 Tax=Vitis vinifera TaxID=29760 RepID=A5AXB5_VITVI|nr:hypothetical protein VITISV_017684 [Vitis vinifera]
MASRLRNSRSTLRVCLQKTITFSFQLQIVHRLKLWTPDFPSFETRYGVEVSQPFRSCEMSVRGFQMALVCQKVVSQLRNTLQNGALAAKLGFFTFWYFAAVSQLRNEVHCAAKWHSCAKMCFAAVKYPAEWSFGCEIGNFHALELRSRFAAAKWGLLCCEVALVCQNWFRSCENFRREGPEAANWFCSKVLILQRLRNLTDLCFSPVFALFLL